MREGRSKAVLADGAKDLGRALRFNGRFKTRFRPLSLLAAIALVLLLPRAASGEDEYKIKAGMLMSLLRGTDWPPGSFHDPSAPYVLGVLGKDPFGPILNGMTNKVVRNRGINRGIVLKRCNTPEEAKDCHLLFISSNQDAPLSSILNSLGKLSILTVGESREFTSLGGIVNLALENDRVSFELSAKALKRARLEIDPGLKEAGKLIK